MHFPALCNGSAPTHVCAAMMSKKVSAVLQHSATNSVAALLALRVTSSLSFPMAGSVSFTPKFAATDYSDLLEGNANAPRASGAASANAAGRILFTNFVHLTFSQ